MATIQHLFNRTIIISRMKADSGFKEHFWTTGTVDAQIQKVAVNEYSEQYGVFGATHRCWVDTGIDIREGDRARDTDGNIYQIVAVTQEGKALAMNEHIAILMKLEQPAVRT